MSIKTIVWLGVFIGSALGGYLPALWGQDLFSTSSLVCGALGGLIGIWAGYKLGTDYLGL